MKRPAIDTVAFAEWLDLLCARIDAARFRHPYLALRAARFVVRKMQAREYPRPRGAVKALLGALWPAIRDANFTERHATDEELWRAAKLLRAEAQGCPS